ncbi:TetR/AcrR family transcriptional regulator [Sporichthya brevicatena]|uniref:TetR/AcrR family transcriptional regulator n=1 Tax=Sporichthya brevicatena TaxID=171442 RepID=A0ABN1GD35_9ACTN
MTVTDRPYRGVSADNRRSERREQLLQACLDVVGRSGVAGTTVGAICEQAGLTKRYFYEAFADRDAILCAALDDLHVALLQRIRTAIAHEPDARERTRLTARMLADTMDDPRLARLFVEAAALPSLHDLRRRAYDVYADLVAHEVLGLTEPSPRARLATQVLVAGATEAVSRWVEGGTGLTRDEFVEVLTELASGVDQG